MCIRDRDEGDAAGEDYFKELNVNLSSASMYSLSDDDGFMVDGESSGSHGRSLVDPAWEEAPAVPVTKPPPRSGGASTETRTPSPAASEPLTSSEPPAKRRKREATPKAPVALVKPHVYHPQKATVGLGEQREWFCGYCGYKKVSASASTDGMVRIRCPCGGVRGDGVCRMHSNWTLTPGEQPECVADEEAGMCYANGFKPVISSRHRPHNHKKRSGCRS
eukprot:TRINITY_DN26442_c0_g1_i1.p1 TRINITY_DN26442_c0_g1~~TRINITY_DN26442_c0_g1_i1.p1  ORF type:complete len:220 (+),score=32.72 TRINITY_DN26442_c0_g1_i1:185-844(+)